MSTVDAPHEPEPDEASGSGRSRWAERGASLVEYTLLIALIALVCFAAVTYFGNATTTSLDDSASCLGDPDAAECPS